MNKKLKITAKKNETEIKKNKLEESLHKSYAT